MNAAELITYTLRQHRRVPETAMSANIRGMCAECRDGAWSEEHQAAAVLAALGGLTREWRAKGFLPNDEKTARLAAASVGGDELQSRWVGGWKSEEPR